jgi:hypothetical protein
MVRFVRGDCLVVGGDSLTTPQVSCRYVRPILKTQGVREELNRDIRRWDSDGFLSHAPNPMAFEPLLTLWPGTEAIGEILTWPYEWTGKRSKSTLMNGAQPIWGDSRR